MIPYASPAYVGEAYFFGGLKPNKPPVLPGETKTLVYEKITSDDRMVVVWRPHYQESKEVINMERNEVNHSAHSTWRCQYHIVFAPKFRRKAIYGQSYARKYSTASKCSTIHGISQGKKHANDIRSCSRTIHAGFLKICGYSYIIYFVLLYLSERSGE